MEADNPMGVVVDLGFERAKKATTSSEINPEHLLMECLEDIRSGRRNPNRLLVLMIKDDENDETNINWYNSNMNTIHTVYYLEQLKLMRLGAI